MVFSKRQVPEGFDPKEFDAYPRIVDMLHFEHNKPQNMEDGFYKFMSEHYYDSKALKEKYGIDREKFDLDIVDEMIYILANDLSISDKIEEYYLKVVEQYKLDPIALYEQYISEETALAHVPDTTLLYIKLMIILSLKKPESVQFMDSLIEESYGLEFNYFKKSKDLRPFEKFRKEVLSKAIGTTEEMASLIPYIYSQTFIEGDYLEKEAIDYYFKRTNHLTERALPVNLQEYSKADKSTKKWIKANKYPESLFDLKKAPELQEQVRFVSQLLKVVSFVPGVVSSVDYEAKEVQAAIALLDKFPSIYKNDKDMRNLLIVIAYAFYSMNGCGTDYVEAYFEEVFKNEKQEKQYKDTIDKLKREISPIKAQLEQKQKALNSIQLDYDRLKNKELAKLKEELEKQKQLQKELQEKINSLEEINSSLEANIEEMEAAVAPSSTTSNKPNSYVENKLKSYNILVMGGHQIWQNRLKEVYPYFTYIDSDNVNFDINITRNADFIFFNTLHCSHTLYYRIKNNVNNGRTNNKEKIVLVSSNNLEYFKNLVTNLMTN